MIYDDKFDHRLTSLILTQDQLAAIGSVVVESTFCEETVETLIWNLAKLDEEQGKFFTGPLQMKSRLELLSTLGKPLLRSAKKQLELTQLISKLKEANNDRNTIVHGTWQTDGVGIMRVMRDGPAKHPPAIAKKRRLNSTPLIKSALEIESTALTIARLTFGLIHFSRAWRRVPSPERQLQRELSRLQSPGQTQPKAQPRKRQPRASPQ